MNVSRALADLEEVRSTRNKVDVFFVMDKGQEKEDLVRLRREICERYIKNKSYRTIETADPARDRGAPSYESAVGAWHKQRADIYERLIGQELSDDECGAFLVWGDPSLYDSTLRIIDRIIAKGTVAFEYEVIPGISAIQACLDTRFVAGGVTSAAQA